MRAAGFEPELGPFGSTVTGELSRVSAALVDLLAAATAAGATRVSLQISQFDQSPAD